MWYIRNAAISTYFYLPVRWISLHLYLSIMCSQDCDLFSTNAAAKVGKSARGSWLANNGTVSKNFTSAHLGTALDPTCSSALHNIPMSSMSHQEINHKTPKNHWWCIVIEKHVLTGDVDFAAFHPLTSWLVISSSTHLLVYTIHGEHVALNGVFFGKPMGISGILRGTGGWNRTSDVKRQATRFSNSSRWPEFELARLNPTS